MIDNTGQIESLIKELSTISPNHVDIYLIGGGAMMFLGSKQYTKDLDFVVCSEGEYNDLSDALKRLGFVSDRPTDGMKKVNLSDTQKRDGYRIDLFCRKICGQLQLTDSMRERAQMIIDCDSVTLFSCAAEDIFLLKSVTEREGDVDDCNSLIFLASQFDWDSLVEEIIRQMGFGESVWITYVMERLERMKIDVRYPDVFNTLSLLEKEYLERWADEFEKNLP